MRTAFNLKAFLNFLGRNKLYTAINILGFSVSLMFVILIAVYTTRSFSADQFHENKDRIFVIDNSLACLVGQDLKNRYPEIEAYIAETTLQETTLCCPGQKIRVNGLYVDSSFFNVFSYELLEGKPSGVLKNKNDIVLTKTFAVKLFGNDSPVGKEVELLGQKLRVSGVAADFPLGYLENPDVLLNIWHHYPAASDYQNASSQIFLLAKKGADLKAKESDMLEFLKSYFWVYRSGGSQQLELLPLSELYMHENWGRGNRTFTQILFSVSLLILIFAIINYINLSVAQTGFRAQEMATRRLLGGTRIQLFLSVITESVLLCTVSLLIGLLLALAGEDAFNRILNTNISVAEYLTPVNLAGSCIFILLLGTIAGCVPATVISNFQPIEVVRGTLRRKTKMVYSKILIAFQYFITISLIGCTIVMVRQTRHMAHHDLGYRTENLIEITNDCLNWSQCDVLKSELMKISGVGGVSAANGALTRITQTTLDSSNPDRPIIYDPIWSDSSFLNVVGLRVLLDNHSTAPDATWLNETAWKELELSPDAQSFNLWGAPKPIAGMVEDFRRNDMTRPIRPMFIAQQQNGTFTPKFIYIRTEGNDPAEIFDKIQQTFRQVSNGEPFVGQFTDQATQKWYEGQKSMTNVTGSLALIAIVISSLGILAMATYFVRQRAREIAMRKVYGSTTGEILYRLIANFLRLVAAGFVVAVPVIWYFMREWLNGFVSKIQLSWLIFAAAGLIAAAIAFATVYWQSRKAANANPVDSVKK